MVRTNKTVLVVIPTYKERANIMPLAERIHSALSSFDYRVLFVDDDSNDGTEEVVHSLAEKYPVDILVRKDKRGLASAVCDGLNHVTTDVAVVMDADLQHPPEVLPALLKRINEGADIAIASRYVPGGGCQDWGLARRIWSKGAAFLSHLLLPSTRRVKDTMSGFFAFRTQALAHANLKPTGYKILLEILIQGKYQNVAEVPYIFENRSRGKSKLGMRQQIDYLKHLYSLMQRSGELWRFVKFLLVGASGILVNEGLLWLLTEYAHLVYLLSSAIAIEVSIISNFVLNDYFTFRDRRRPSVSSMSGRLLKFNLVSLAGLLINLGVLWIFTSVLGVYYLVSNLVGIALAFLWNYFVNSLWTWKYTLE
jgi:dolichol-phosphate mannosyltransferase